MTTNTDAVPSTPAATWRINGEPDPHYKQYDCERAALTLGNLTDDELANGVFMNADQPMDIARVLARDPNYHSPIVWLTAAKERIRWLSRSLERALVAPPESQPAAERVDTKFLFVAMDEDGTARASFCVDDSDVYEVVRASMYTHADLDRYEAEQVQGSTNALIESGALHFEGDPSIYLYRLHAPASSTVDQA